MIYFLYLICFLIISCDLPNEANKDCNGRSGGLAFIDDCGVCSAGDTNITPNIDKDLCGVCFGNNPCYEPQCNDESSINYFENALNIDNSLCIYDLCDENNSYINANDDFNCDVQGNPPYEIDEYLSCETLQKEFDICYPEDCGSVKLADFEDKNILIIYEFDWWPGCYPNIPQLEEDIITPFINHPDLAIINVINDGPGSQSCQTWGENGDDRIPIIINESSTGLPGDFNNWFAGSGDWSNPYSSPWYILIDNNFKYVYISAFGADHHEILDELNVLLEN